MQRAFGTLFVVLLAVLWCTSRVEASVECPLGAEGCLDEDVSALLQLAAAKQQDIKLDTGAAACPSKGVQAYITRRTLDYIAQEVFPISLANVWLPIPPITGDLNGTTYSILNVQLVTFEAGHAALALLPGQGLEISIANISLKLSLTYAMGLSMFGANIAQSGTVVVDVTNTSIAMKVIFGPNDKGHPSVHVQDVQVHFELKDVTFADQRDPAVSLSNLGFLWSSVAQPLARAAAESLAKSTMGEHLKVDVAETLAQLLGNSTLPLKNTTEPHPYEIQVQACDFEVTAQYLALNAFVKVDTPGGGAHPEASGYNLSSLLGYQVVTDQMLGVAATEWTIDGLLWLVRRSAGLLSLLAAEPPAPLRLREHPGLLPDGRDMQAVAEANTKEVVKDPRLQSSLLPKGLQITETKVRFFNQAVAALLSFSLDVPALVASLFPPPTPVP